MLGAYLRFLMVAAVSGGMLIPAAPLVAQLQDEQSGGQFGSFGLFGQSAEPIVTVAAQFTVPSREQPGRLFVTATIKPPWHIYSITQAPGGPVRTTIELTESAAYRRVGEFRSIVPPEKKAEEVFEGLVVETHHGSVTWYAPIELRPGIDPATIMIEGVVKAQSCDSKSCMPSKEFPFTASLGPGVPLPATGPAAPAEQPAEAASGTQGVASGLLAATLAGAFLGGLILNLTPCVLPVISLKLLAFIEQAGQSRGQAFALNVWYSAGLMLVFLILATLSASFSLAWGEQFTHTWFKVTLTALVFVMALSFLGVWEIPIPGFVGSGKAGELQLKEGATGAFFKGIFTTILATPCAGPFLGPVFGFMLGQPPYVPYLVMGSVGLGMASPYLIIGAFPELIRFLPKPGAWMETLKQAMAFLLLGTVVYLFTTMSERYFVPTLTLLVGLWFACWLIGRTPITASASRRESAWLAGLAVAALVGVFSFTVLLQDLKLSWETFSPDALARARSQGKTVMVDFTADWCPNCKWNLAWAIDTKRVSQLVQQNGVVPMIADWTDHSPMIKEVLTKDLKRQSVPVLAIWPAGAPDDGVIILDGTLSESQVLDALERAGPSRSATQGSGPEAAMTSSQPAATRPAAWQD